MNLIVIGMNHKTAPLELREKPALCCVKPVAALERIKAIPSIEEVLYLSTCNRFELIARIGSEHAVPQIKAFLLSQVNIEPEELEKIIYVHRNEDAVKHIFRVAASLDSMVMGEPQILGQVKEAYRQSVGAKSAGIILNKVLHAAFRTAKRVRTETGVANNAVSVSFAAVELAKKIFSELKGKTVLLIGAGEMSELAARHLVNNGTGKVLIANRTYERAEKMAGELHGHPVRVENLEEALGEADIIISSTGASGYVLNQAMVSRALKRHRSRLLFIIDIAVPRDVDPAVGHMDNVFLYNIDDLQDIVDGNIKNRMAEALKAEEIISEEVVNFSQWYQTLEVVPTIVSLKNKMETIMRTEIENTSWIKRLSREEQKNIEALASAILNKVLHEPISSLKDESKENGAVTMIAVIRKLFKLDGEKT
jgi:glutamyl-tRNA reductase